MPKGGGSKAKNLPASTGDRVQFLSWEDPLEKEMATHSNVLAGRIPRTEGTSQVTVHGVVKELHMT